MAATQVQGPPARRRVSRAVLWLLVAGAAVQIVMSAYYLSQAHAPKPRNLPVGFVATAQATATVQQTIEEGNRFSARSYTDATALASAIKDKSIYGGVDVSTSTPHLYVASAAGPAAATAMRTVFTTVVQQQTATQVDKLIAAGQPVAPALLRQLTTPAAVTDVVPLPADDSAGASIGLLIQCLTIGASVAAMGLGRLRPLTRPSMRRSIGHVLLVVAYAAASAAAILAAAHLFGVIPDGAAMRMFWTLTVVALAVTGSVAGLIALIGPAGSFLGTAYFLFGLPVSGATVLPDFLPAAGRIFGQALPTGAGATLVRDSLYFPDASVTTPATVLAVYAGIGILLVLITNALANRSKSDSVFEHPHVGDPARPADVTAGAH